MYRLGMVFCFFFFFFPPERCSWLSTQKGLLTTLSLTAAMVPDCNHPSFSKDTLQDEATPLSSFLSVNEKKIKNKNLALKRKSSLTLALLQKLFEESIT